MSRLGDAVGTALDGLTADLETALPAVLSGLVFLVLATVVVFVVLRLVSFAVGRVLPGEPVYAQFVTTVAGVFLWFAVALTFLTVVGLGQIAAALGTASGFLALGVSYALSGMIADAVSGGYLLRDPDFNPGDRVDAAGTVGTVRTIELRKTRIETAEGLVVRGNAEIEKRWTKLDD